MLGFSGAAQFMSAPGQSYSVSAFKKPMQDSLGISETDLSFAYGMATIVSGLLLPSIGRLVDRYGSRTVLPVVAALLGLACMVMSWVSSMPMLFVGFALIRCLGQGAMWLIGTWIVGEWFLRKRGLATAISGLGNSFSVMLFPILNLYLITEYGWRSAWQVLGLIVALTMVVPVVLFFRDKPEDLGLHPDGIDPATQGPPEIDPKSTVAAPTEDSWTLREVLYDLTFWKLASVGVTTGMIGTGLVFHQQTILAPHEITKEFAMQLISIQAFIGTLAAFAAGWLTDRFPTEKLMATAMLMLAAAVSSLYFMPHWSFVFIYAICSGLLGAILRTAGTVVWVNYYGRQNQGVIRGAASSLMILAAAVGPLPLAMSNDRWGSYSPALFAYTLIPLFSMAFVYTAKQPKRL